VAAPIQSKGSLLQRSLWERSTRRVSLLVGRAQGPHFCHPHVSAELAAPTARSVNMAATISFEQVRDATLFLFDTENIECPLALSTEMYARLYTIVYHACTQKPPNNHCEAIHNFLEDHLRDFGAAFVDEHVDLDSISAYMPAFCSRVRLIVAIFKFVNRVYIRRRGLAGIFNFAAQGFCSAVVAKLQPSRMAKGRIPTKAFDECLERLRASKLAVEKLHEVIKRFGHTPVTTPKPKHRQHALVSQLMSIVEAKRDPEIQGRRLLHPKILQVDAAIQERDKEAGLNTTLCFAVEVGKQQLRIRGLMERWRRVSFKVGRIAAFVRGHFTEVHFRPSNRGFELCKRNYEDTRGEYECHGISEKKQKLAACRS
jgi:hypothetical protein